MDPEYGSLPHMHEMFEPLRDANPLVQQGDAATKARWFQLAHRFRYVRKWLRFVLTMLIFIGLHLNWFPDVDRSPLSWDWLREDTDVEEAPALLDEDQDDSEDEATRRRLDGAPGAGAGPATTPDQVAGSNLAPPPAAKGKNALFIVA